jgi:hypothetical protein
MNDEPRPMPASGADAQVAAPGASVAMRPAWRADRLRRVLLVAYFAAFAFLPFLASGVFPSQDGPAHLQTAAILSLLRAGGAPIAALFLHEADPGFSNAVAPWILSRLLDALSPTAAEWSMALGLTALLLGAVMLAVKALSGRLRDAALGVLLCAPVMLYMGSFSLVLAYAFSFTALVFGALHAGGGRPSHALLFAAASVTACVVQVQVAVPIAAAVFGGVVGAVGWRVLRGGGGLSVPRPYMTLAAASLPAIGLALLHRSRVPDSQMAEDLLWAPLRQVAVLLLRRDVAWFWFTDGLLLGATTTALGAVAAWWLLRGLWRGSAPDAPDAAARCREWALWAAVAVAVLAVALPRHSAAAPQIPERMAPFAHFLAFLWFITTPLPEGWRRAVVALALTAGLAHTAMRTAGHVELARRQAELSWAEAQVPDGAVINALDLPRAAGIDKPPTAHLLGLPLAFDPFLHLGRVTGRRDVADLSNYQVRSVFSIFRVRVRSTLEVSGIALGELWMQLGKEALPGGLDGYLERLRAATGRDLDLLVVWTGGLEVEAAARDRPALRTFLDDLAVRYERVGRSSPNGYAEVWRRR